MDEKNQIKDLPEPVAIPLTFEERTVREWRLLRTFIQFVTLYASIHKLFIPLVLKATALADTLYAEIQYSLFYSVVLTLSLRRFEKNTPWISFCAGLCVVYAGWEIYLTVIGQYVGWFAFSRLLSSTPLGASCVILLSQKRFGRFPSFAWMGAASFLICAVAGLSSNLQKPESKSGESDLKVAPSIERGIENAVCGAQSLRFSSGEKNVSQGNVFISECGLNPSTWVHAGGSIQIENKTEFPVNLHVLFYDGAKKSSGWNILVPAKQKITTPKFEISKGRIGLLYSDSKADVGIIGLIAQELDSGWILSRKPISAQKMN